MHDLVGDRHIGAEALDRRADWNRLAADPKARLHHREREPISVRQLANPVALAIGTLAAPDQIVHQPRRHRVGAHRILGRDGAWKPHRQTVLAKLFERGSGG